MIIYKKQETLTLNSWVLLLTPCGALRMENGFVINEIEREKLISSLVDELPVLRLKLGVSQDEIANMLDISRQTYCSLETKKRKMSWSVFLSLILIFYHNEATRDFVSKAGLLPQKLLHISDVTSSPAISSFVQMENDDIRNHLDEQAIHAIETVIMMEYARCNNMTGEAVIKAFDGKRLTQVSEQDIRARSALERIKAESEKK